MKLLRYLVGCLVCAFVRCKWAPKFEGRRMVGYFCVRCGDVVLYVDYENKGVTNDETE